MNKKMNFIIACAAVVLAVTSILNAEVYKMEIFTSNSKFHDSQKLNFEVKVNGLNNNKVGFEIINKSKIQSSITGIFFDCDSILGHITKINNDPWRTFFVKDRKPENLPGGKKIDFKANQSASSIFPPISAFGVNPEEWVRITMNLKNGFTFDDVITGINNGQIRVGAHITGIGSCRSGVACESAVTTPEPATLALLGLGALILRKRK